MYGKNTIVGSGVARGMDCTRGHELAQATQGLIAPNPTPVESGIVNEIAEQLGGRLMRLRDLNASLEVLADRLLGGVPTGTDSGATQPQAPGQVGNLGAAIPFTDYLLDQLSAHVKRLEQL